MREGRPLAHDKDEKKTFCWGVSQAIKKYKNKIKKFQHGLTKRWTQAAPAIRRSLILAAVYATLLDSKVD